MSRNMFLTVISIATIFSAPFAVANSYVPLGSCYQFALQAATSIAFNGALTTVNTDRKSVV